MSANRELIEHDLEVALVRSLFNIILPSLVMSIGFLCCSLLIWLEVGEPVILVLALAGIAASGIRIIVLLAHISEARSELLDIQRARILERRFAASYIGFAVTLGAFSAAVFGVGSDSAKLLGVCLLVGYAAGVAAVAGLRPRIAIISIGLAVIPGAVVLTAHAQTIMTATGIMMLLFLVGGWHSIFERHARVRREVAERLTFAGLARQDHLTGLSNRLGLQEHFSRLPRSDAFVAVHCLDLDGFKPLNDRYGHPFGDRVLLAIALRFREAISADDIVARLGGDEFAVIQGRVSNIGEAQLFARRLRDVVGHPLLLQGYKVSVSTSVGYVVVEHAGENLNAILENADEALYRAKRSFSKIASYEPIKVLSAATAA